MRSCMKKRPAYEKYEKYQKYQISEPRRLGAMGPWVWGLGAMSHLKDNLEAS